MEHLIRGYEIQIIVSCQGDRACPPKPLLRCAIVLFTFPGVIAFGGSHSGEGETP